MPSLFCEKRVVRGPVKMNFFRPVRSSASSYVTERMTASTEYEGRNLNAASKSATNGGTKDSVKKKFQCTPYSVTCSA